MVEPKVFVQLEGDTKSVPIPFDKNMDVTQLLQKIVTIYGRKFQTPFNLTEIVLSFEDKDLAAKLEVLVSSLNLVKNTSNNPIIIKVPQAPPQDTKGNEMDKLRITYAKELTPFRFLGLFGSHEKIKTN